MLKIRISGTKEELNQVAKQIGDGEIRKFKQPSGKTTYAIDTVMSVNEFLSKNFFATNPPVRAEDVKTMSEEMTEELNQILDIINDPKS